MKVILVFINKKKKVKGFGYREKVTVPDSKQTIKDEQNYPYRGRERRHFGLC